MGLATERVCKLMVLLDVRLELPGGTNCWALRDGCTSPNDPCEATGVCCWRVIGTMYAVATAEGEQEEEGEVRGPGEGEGGRPLEVEETAKER